MTDNQGFKQTLVADLVMYTWQTFQSQADYFSSYTKLPSLSQVDKCFMYSSLFILHGIQCFKQTIVVYASAICCHSSIAWMDCSQMIEMNIQSG